MLRLDVVDAQLRQQRGEAGNAAPRPEGRATVAHHHLGFAMALDRGLEGLNDQLGALGVLDAMPDDETRTVVQVGPRAPRLIESGLFRAVP